MKVARTGQRLAQRIAQAGLCSRREAEAWVRAGRVKVDGEIVISPACNVTGQNIITVDGKKLGQPAGLRLFLYHKPPGLVVTHKDEKGRPTVFDHLPKELPRLVSVGRLDLNSEGLLLLTSSGELARHLELPSTGWVRRYRLRVFGPMTPAMIEAIAQGVTVEGVRYGPIEVKREESSGQSQRNKWLLASLAEGKNRELRRVFESFGCKISRLIRLSYGPFHLGNLPRSGLKEVPSKVVREQLGAWMGHDSA